MEYNINNIRIGTKILHISSNSIHTIKNIVTINDTDKKFTYETQLGFKYEISSIVLQVQIENKYLKILSY